MQLEKPSEKDHSEPYPFMLLLRTEVFPYKPTPVPGWTARKTSTSPAMCY